MKTPKTKTCSRCREDLPLKEFHRNRKTADGRMSKCRDCTRDTDSPRKRAWQAGQDQVHIPKDLTGVVDYHAQAVGLSRRAMILRTLNKYTASAAKDVAVEQETRGRKAREQLEGGEER